MYYRVSLLVLLFSLLPAAPATADQHVSYDHVALEYLSIDRNVGPDPEGRGLSLSGMFSVGEHWHGLAELTDATIEFGAPFGDLEYSTWRIGGGYHTELSEGIDALAEVSLDRVDSGRTATGLGLRFGLRGMATDELELGGHVRYTGADDVRSADALLGVSAAWRLGEQFALTFGYESGDVATLRFGLRLHL